MEGKVEDRRKKIEEVRSQEKKALDDQTPDH
jgi:hypothetical protein